MPIIIKGETFTIPSEAGTPALTGREIVGIEDAFGLDGLTLMRVIGEDSEHPNPKYTQSKALYALAWVVMNRAGKKLSMDEVLDGYTIEDFNVTDSPADSPKAEAAN